MKKHLVLILTLLLLASFACDILGGAEEPAAEPAVEPAQQDTADVVVVMPDEEPAEPAAEPLPEEPEGIPAPNIEVNGGFTTNYREVNDLPSLIMPLGGRGPSPCERTSPDSSFTYINVMEMASQLCIFDYPLEVGSPPITLTVTSPDGQTYSDTFTLVQGDNVIDAYNAMGQSRGWVEDMMSDPPAIILFLNFTADLPTGTWSVHADNGTLTADTTIERDLSSPLVSVFDVPPSPGPFYQFRAYETMFDTGDIAYFVGTGYAPNTELVIAAYTRIPGGVIDEETGMELFHAPYATTVMTDATGTFETSFMVGSGTPNGEYMLVADPFTQDWVHPHMGRFIIREFGVY